MTLRQVSKLDPGAGRQALMLTSEAHLTAGQVCFRIGCPVAGGGQAAALTDATVTAHF